MNLDDFNSLNNDNPNNLNGVSNNMEPNSVPQMSTEANPFVDQNMNNSIESEPSPMVNDNSFGVPISEPASAPVEPVMSNPVEQPMSSPAEPAPVVNDESISLGSIDASGNVDTNMNVQSFNPLTGNLDNPSQTMDANTTKNNGGKKKTPMIIGIAVVVLVAALAGGFFFIKSKYTATKFIDGNVKLLTSYIEKAFADDEIIGDYDLMKDDIVTNGTIELSSKNSTLSMINNLKYSYKTALTLDNEYLQQEVELSQDSSSFKAKGIIDKDTIYVDSADIYNKALKYATGDNYFKELKDALKEYNDQLNTKQIKKIKKLMVNSIKYMGEALKEAEIETKQEGLKVKYIYEINDNNKAKISNKFYDLLNADADYKELKELVNNSSNNTYVQTDFEEELSLENSKLVIVTDMVSGELESFELTFKDDDKDNVIKCEKTAKNKYKLTSSNSKEYANIEVSKDSVSVVAYGEDNKKIGTVNVTLSDKLTKVEVKADAGEFNLNYDKSTGKLVMKFSASGVELNIDATIKEEKNKYSYSGTVEVIIDPSKLFGSNLTTSSETYDLTVKFDLNVETGSGLINKETISGATDIESLSQFDLDQIETNVTNKLTEFKFVSELSNLFGSKSSYNPSPYDDYYDYYNDYNDYNNSGSLFDNDDSITTYDDYYTTF